MPDVLLIQPPNIKGALFNLPGREIPLSLLYISAYLKQSGFDCDVFDLSIERDPDAALRRRLYSSPPQVVGLTSYTTNVGVAATIAHRVKQKWPGATLVLGGFHASALPEETLKEFPVFDLLVFGEGERTLTDIMHAIGSGGDFKSIRGLAYSQNGETRINPPRELIDDLDTLPFPEREAVPIRRYVPDPGNYASLPTTGILFSRGCPMKCAFCSKSVFADTIRYRSADCFLDEVEQCTRRYGIKDFRFFDEGPTLRKKNMCGLCEKIISRDMKFTWNCFSRVDTVDDELLRLMSRAGCYHVIYGVESANPETQQRINKRIDLRRVEEVCRSTRAYGIECKVNFILGFPWEDQTQAEENIRFALSLETDLATFNLFKPLPGSALYAQLKAEGRLIARPWEDYFTTSDSQIFTSALPPEQWGKILKSAWMRFYFHPNTLLRRLRRLRRHPMHELRNSFVGLSVLLRNLFR